MTQNGEETLETTNSQQLLKVLERLTFTQKRFVIARQETQTDKEAAEKIEIRPGLVYDWRARGFPVDEALRLMAQDGVAMALDLRRKALAKAMATKIGGLDSSDENVKQRAATEIIEWELGKATATVETLLKGELSIDHSSDAELVKAAKEVIAVRAGDAFSSDQ